MAAGAYELVARERLSCRHYRERHSQYLGWFDARPALEAQVVEREKASFAAGA